MFKKRALTIGVHIVGWLLFLSFPLIFINGVGSQQSAFALLSHWYFWEFGFAFLLLFYLNSRVLIPLFFLKKRYVAYFAVVAALFAGFYLLQPFERLISYTRQFDRRDFRQEQFGRFGDRPGFGRQPDFRRPPHEGGLDNRMPLPPPDSGDSILRSPRDSERQLKPGDTAGHRRIFGGKYHFPPSSPGDEELEHRGGRGGRFSPFKQPHGYNHIDTMSLFIFIMIIALGTAVEITQQWRITEQRAIQAEADKANAELSFLKAQINPHFLFNTLNNIYTLAVTQSANTADSIMKLSNIMRYVTDDVTIDYVPLQSEIECIEDYIELQRMRIGAKTDVRFEVTGEAVGVKVAPLIMMTFVENVFKYGVSKREASVIRISIDIKGHTIRFYCHNKIFDGTGVTREGGVGIANTRQRLQHLYAGRHELKITTNDGFYNVNLTLETA